MAKVVRNAGDPFVSLKLVRLRGVGSTQRSKI